MRSHSAPFGGRIGACPSLQRGINHERNVRRMKRRRLISGLHIGARILLGVSLPIR